MGNLNSDKIFEDSFGLWISGLFSAISGNNPELTFEQQKQAFFYLLKKWLESGRIKICDPNDPLGRPWTENAEVIVSYLKERWPASSSAEDDSDLNLYFYEIPAILWVDKDGNLHGS